tara:strand:- start:25 stop:159 length:135 start_codon:yes stop_codon:yes gene_type:complete
MGNPKAGPDPGHGDLHQIYLEAILKSKLWEAFKQGHGNIGRLIA